MLWLLRFLDRHGRSHNITAGCCVESRSESAGVTGLVGGEYSNTGAAMEFWEVTSGSCLMTTLVGSKRSSINAGDAGLGAESDERESMRDGAGVGSL